MLSRYICSFDFNFMLKFMQLKKTQVQIKKDFKPMGWAGQLQHFDFTKAKA